MRKYTPYGRAANTALEANAHGRVVHYVGTPGDPLEPYHQPEYPCLQHAMFLEAMDRQICEEEAALVDGMAGKTYHPHIPVVVRASGGAWEQWGGGAEFETHGRISFIGVTKDGVEFDAAIHRPWQDSYAPHLPNSTSTPDLDTIYDAEAARFPLVRAFAPNYSFNSHQLGYFPFQSFVRPAKQPSFRHTHYPFDTRVYNTWLPVSRRPSTAWRDLFSFRRFALIAETREDYARRQYDLSVISGSEPDMDYNDYLPPVISWTAAPGLDAARLSQDADSNADVDGPNLDPDSDVEGCDSAGLNVDTVTGSGSEDYGLTERYDLCSDSKSNEGDEWVKISSFSEAVDGFPSP
ncbi:hypothetical protein BD410DRAFT_844992 [Rickenella mellea]|uniref:Uncharacterized protein n=1 Tax=Rickenella mellea TaxID=50990 RepID=A0A4Y7PLK4_9AGAM|nr:hypothetical protein BD410DRAFT_844992 [Rickenella mellea]